ncbi:ketopantoate reductase family protein [Rathayibacter soli]|uniref:ketopantoate reductase family protein n=1 Tax=Rathayibacter soli TaxID=3144168 RepID=UPI0027E3B7A6|nr:2-dehydropantoate 2-reductase [Glaciibacter superstes]
MRIGVIGAGAIGGTIAALLDRAGHEVEVTARGRGLAAIRSGGLHLTGRWGDHVAAIAANEALTSTPELAFICTKAQDAAAAIDTNSSRLAGIPVVIVQNGLEGLEAAAAKLPNSTCIGALALYAANYTQPGSVMVTATGNTYLGAGTLEPTAAIRTTAALLDTAMPTQAAANFVGCQWTKLIINEVNAMPAITGLSVQETIAGRHLRRIITAAMREAVRLGMDIGIRFGSLQGLNNAALRAFARMPLTVGQVLPALMARRMGATPNLGSTLQSLKRGQATEIDYLSGAVVSAAVAHGRRAPVNAALVALVHEVERTGSFASVDEVVTAVGR